MIKSIEPSFALKGRRKAVFAAIRGKYWTLQGRGTSGLGGPCSIFYRTVVEKNEQG
jgi:hypothetical protein